MVFLVAELGVNWKGDFELVQKMMLNAKTLGCSAVKFQAFNETILGNHPQLSLLMKSAITEENIERVDQIANDIGIEWFCTPMYPEAVTFLNPFVKRFKIMFLVLHIQVRFFWQIFPSYLHTMVIVYYVFPIHFEFLIS